MVGTEVKESLQKCILKCCASDQQAASALLVYMHMSLNFLDVRQEDREDNRFWDHTI